VGADVTAIEQAMTEIRRRQARRSPGELADLQAWGRDDLALLPALEAIEELGDQATVGAVAALVGLDRSSASRTVSAGVRAGYVVRMASQSDGRSTFLRLSEQGERFTRFAHEYRHARIEQALTGWSRKDRAQLATLMARFTDGLRREVSTKDLSVST
jgi:DNA-binding MarR family transcriptional regulator